MLNALDIKVALTDFLLKTDLWSDDSILASEVPFCFGFRRADMILLSNGATHSFEIKSDADSLLKLGEQINDYRTTFEYSWVVTTPRHFAKAISILPNTVGIIVAMDKYPCSIYRAAKENKRPSKYNLTTLLSAREIVKTMQSNGKFPNLKILSLNLLREYAEKQLTISQLQDAVYMSLYNKYKKSFGLFKYDIGDRVTHADLSYLSRMK